MSFSRAEPIDVTRYVVVGALVSLAVHIILFYLLFVHPSLFTSEQNTEAPLVVEVNLAELPHKAPAQEQRQIVSPPDTSTTREPLKEAYQSEKDSSVEHEQIKRGDGADAGVPQPQQQKAVASKEPAKEAPKPQQQSPASKVVKPTTEEPVKSTQPKSLQHLRLDPATLQSKVLEEQESSTEDKLRAALSGPQSSNALASTTTTQPFSRASGSGARFLGAPGTNDYLPNLPDGDITLLNTKANVFAVFVRRVALQVFSQIRSAGWDVLRSSDINSINKDSTVRAILSPQGKLLKVLLEEESGSGRFDDVLISAVRSGARDPNPPKGAEADDGNIHFIFKARTWAGTGSGRGGGPMERRWLVLSTGLD